jgi:hypothetical protein
MSPDQRVRIEEALTDAERDVLALWCRRLGIPADQWPLLCLGLSTLMETQAWLERADELQLDYIDGSTATRLHAADDLHLDFDTMMQRRRRYSRRSEMTDVRHGER